MRDRLPVYAIIRFDNFEDVTEESWAIKCVVLTEAEAESEVKRLNELARKRGWDTVYRWRTTRLISTDK